MPPSYSLEREGERECHHHHHHHPSTSVHILSFLRATKKEKECHHHHPSTFKHIFSFLRATKKKKKECHNHHPFTYLQTFLFRKKRNVGCYRRHLPTHKHFYFIRRTWVAATTIILSFPKVRRWYSLMVVALPRSLFLFISLSILG